MTVTAAILGCNPLLAARMSSNKYLTSCRLRQGGFRVPPSCLFTADAFQSANQLSSAMLEFSSRHFPVVIKSVKGHGGTRVFAGIEDEEELHWAVQQIWRKWESDLVVEKHVVGTTYRLNIFDGSVIGILAKYPGAVTGDGVSAIHDLIEQKNLQKKLAGAKPIRISVRMSHFLAKSGYAIDSVLPAGVTQPLCSESNSFTGGDLEHLPVDILSMASTRYFAAATVCLGLRWAGLDIVAKDIGDQDVCSKGYIIESNSAAVPREFEQGMSRETYLEPALKILSGYFSIDR